ncbi:MAG: ATP-binding protein [Gammaproteobacteria bacterium]|nr:ATP-binding protein [Gammaproteobacteria bacterium]
MIQVEPTLEEAYIQALREHLAGGGEVSLRHGYELGRRALVEGLGVLAMVNVYANAVQTLLRSGDGGSNNLNQIVRGHAFLIESLSPFEITHRSFREANAVLHRLNETIEEETKRIAHTLHDDATQLLAVVHFALADLAYELPSSKERIQEIRGHLDRIEGQLRDMSHELRPTLLDDLGLLPALEFLAKGITKRTGVTINVEGSMADRPSATIETTLYRIVQEALVNASKHAHASQVRVLISRATTQLHCSVRDNGVGFNPQEVETQKGRRGLGLIAIRERLNALGGTLRINSAPKQGTELLISIPLRNK